MQEKTEKSDDESEWGSRMSINNRQQCFSQISWSFSQWGGNKWKLNIFYISCYFSSLKISAGTLRLMPINEQWKSSSYLCQWKVRWHVIVHKTFLELYSKNIILLNNWSTSGMVLKCTSINVQLVQHNPSVAHHQWFENVTFAPSCTHSSCGVLMFFTCLLQLVCVFF